MGAVDHAQNAYNAARQMAKIEAARIKGVQDGLREGGLNFDSSSGNRGAGSVDFNSQNPISNFCNALIQREMNKILSGNFNPFGVID